MRNEIEELVQQLGVDILHTTDEYIAVVGKNFNIRIYFKENGEIASLGYSQKIKFQKLKRFFKKIKKSIDK